MTIVRTRVIIKAAAYMSSGLSGWQSDSAQVEHEGLQPVAPSDDVDVHAWPVICCPKPYANVLSVCGHEAGY